MKDTWRKPKGVGIKVRGCGGLGWGFLVGKWRQVLKQ